jgi:protoheme ferro-lyase
MKLLFWKTLLLSLFIFLLGYMGTLYLFMNGSEIRVVPEITRTKGDAGLGHTAVVLLVHGEPETYDADAWIRQMQEFDQQNIPFIPYPIRPFFFYNLREKYLLLGKSGHNFELLQVMNQMEAEYRKRGDTKTKFYISYLENEPHPDTAVIQATNEGASSIIISNVFLTISSHTQEAIEIIEPLKLEDYNISIKYTKPLYDSKTLQQLYVDKVSSIVTSLNKEKVGVVLVGHGQPTEWDEKFYTQTQLETSFRTDIFRLLELKGYNPQNLKLAWMEFKNPTPKEAVNELIANSVTDIFYFSTIIGSESMHSKSDVPTLMQKVKIPSTVRLQQLTAFEDKYGIVKALMERIDDVLK